MCITELDTFVKKFHQLWNDGVTAHLDLDTHAGDAWVGLRVRLGQVPGPLHYQVHPFHQDVLRKVSPSRHRAIPGEQLLSRQILKKQLTLKLKKPMKLPMKLQVSRQLKLMQL